MKKLIPFMIAAVLAFAPAAQAASDMVGVYVAPKISLGIGHYSAKAHNGNQSFGMGSTNKAVFGGALALGYDFQKRFDLPVRAELEYAIYGNQNKSWSPANTTDTTVKNRLGVQSLFVNVYYDFHTSTGFTPYVGAGLGMGFLNNKGSLDVAGNGISASRTTTNFAWNVGLGCAYAFTDNVSVDLGYRYASFGSAKSGTFTNNNVDAYTRARNVGMHQFMLGARFTF